MHIPHPHPREHVNKILSRLGGALVEKSDYLGGLALLTHRLFRVVLRGKIPVGLTIEQFYYLGIRSLSLTNLVALFTGMVMALQFIVGLKRFGLQLYTGQVVGIAIVRELGPVLTALMVAARVGSGIASELGSMAVTEQVLAVEAMGANPTAKLVLPRVLATMLVTPLLTIIADVVGIFGGMVVTGLEAGVAPRFYLDQVLRTVAIHDFMSGIAKSLFFGFFIGLIACHQGLKTRGGTQGVGEATTQAVVISSVAVFITDYFLTKVFLLF